MPDASALLIGFSMGAALLLALAFSTVYRRVDLPSQSRLGGYVMFAALLFTQWSHLRIIQSDAPMPLTRAYVVVLFLQAVGFYWLVLGVLRPAGRRWEWTIPMAVLVVGALVPLVWAIPLGLAIGAGFALHLAALLYRLRAMRQRFRLEVSVVLLFAVMGVAAGATGLAAPFALSWVEFARFYSALIALGLFLVVWLLLAVPDLALKTQEAVALSYAQSTLGRVDVDAKLAALRQLFERDRIHRDESLSLGRAYELLALSPHQLSELVNVRLATGFSKMVRHYRVQDAKRMLLGEPNASVLSVGMAVGFASQSTFYIAFKEVQGTTPAQFRRTPGESRIPE
ncbi:MAG: AraC family transcriptional regulator [Rhodanobacter sp.]